MKVSYSDWKLICGVLGSLGFLYLLFRDMLN